jgi:nitrite reductase/ring-hydroxylating ferredoxin subunit
MRGTVPAAETAMIDVRNARSASNACATCEQAPTADQTTRRQFLRCTGTVFSLSLLGLGRDAAALPIAMGNASDSKGSEHRYPVPAADGVTIDRSNQIIVVRYQNALYAFNLACPHENTALKWLPKDRRFQCPKHESQYQPTGIFTSGRATRNMDRLGVRLEDNALVVDVSKFFQSDKNPAGWAAAVVAL